MDIDLASKTWNLPSPHGSGGLEITAGGRSIFVVAPKIERRERNTVDLYKETVRICDDEVRAIAALLCAAPHLYNALRSLRGYILTKYGDDVKNSVPVLSAASAIAKAEGK